MREAGSTTGAWNPDPDEHILGMLREDVELSPNESKFVAYVKFCCTRQKPAGRTAWGFTETGKPLRLTEIRAFFGWDWGNAEKYSKRPLAYGFIRKNADGQFGLGARVQGRFSEDDPGSEPPSEVDLLVCTDKLPRYLAEALVMKKYPSKARENFLQGWRSIKAEAQKELNSEKQRIYDREQERLSEHCKTFDAELPDLKRKAKSAEESSLSVQTSSVQNGGEAAYNAVNGSVPTAHIRRQSKAHSSYRYSSSSEATTTTEFPPGCEKARIAEAMAAYVVVDDDLVHRLTRECLEKDPECTAEEIINFAHAKGAVARGKTNPSGFLKAAVVNCFGERLRRAREQRREKPDISPTEPFDTEGFNAQMEELLGKKAMR